MSDRFVARRTPALAKLEPRPAARRLIYDRSVDAAAPPAEFRRLLTRIPHGSRVVEVGCHTGYFTRLLRHRGCYVVGVECDVEAAGIARAHANEVLVLDIEDEQGEIEPG